MMHVQELMRNKDMSYTEVWDGIMAYVERKSDLFGSQVKAVEVDRFEHNEWGKYAAEKDIHLVGWRHRPEELV